MLVIKNNSHRFHLSLLSIYNQQQQLNNNDNATTQQQLDYAICMWYQSTLEHKLLKSTLEHSSYFI